MNKINELKEESQQRINKTSVGMQCQD
jgi:hypothetical protein